MESSQALLVMLGARLFYFTSNASKDKKRQIKAIFRSFKASSEKSFIGHHLTFCAQIHEAPFRVLTTLLCHKYFCDII